MDDLICTICNEFYNSKEKKPRLFPNCGHTFCSDCITHLIKKNKKEIFCPEDDTKCEFYREHLGIEAFPVNFALQKLLENSNKKKELDSESEEYSHSEAEAEAEAEEENNEFKEENLDEDQEIKELNDVELAYMNARRGSRISDFSGINFCMDHQKIAELICLTDKCVICSDCVLFGNHNNHQYNKVIDFKKKVKNKINELEKREMEFRSNNEFDIFDEKRDYREFLQNKVTDSKNKISDNIKISFDELRNKLKEKENDIKQNITKLFFKFEENLEIIKKSSEDLKRKNRDFSNNVHRIKEELESKNPNFEFLLEKVYSNEYLVGFQKTIKRDIASHERKTKELIENELEKYTLETDLNPIINEIQNCFDIVVEDELKDKKSISINNEDSKKNYDDLEEDDKNDIISTKKRNMDKINVDSEDFDINNPSFTDSLDEKEFSDKSGEKEKEINYENKKMKKNTSFLTKEQKEENDRKLFSSKNILNNLYGSTGRNDNINFNPPKNNFYSNTPNLYSNNVSSNLYESNVNKSGMDLKGSKNFYNRAFNTSRKKSFRELSLKKPMKSKRNNNKNFSKKSEINYAKMNITDNLLFNILKDIKKDPNVKYVDLSYNQITSKGFDNILKRLYNHPSLEKINLKCNFLDEKIFKSLNNYCTKLNKLKIFIIQENKISKKKSSVKMNISNFTKYGIKIKII